MRKYKKLWSVLGKFILESWNQSCETGVLPPSHKESVKKKKKKKKKKSEKKKKKKKKKKKAFKKNMGLCLYIYLKKMRKKEET